MSIFEKAARKKLRFDTPKGLISAEDLWDLPLQSQNGCDLDNLAKALNRAVKDSAEESFVEKPTPQNAELTLGFEIVKHVITVKMEENKKALNARARKLKREKIAEIISKKQDGALEEMDITQLQALLDEDEAA